MKYRLTHHQIPRGGEWIILDPMSQKWVRAPAYPQLMDKLYAMYRQNGWPIGLGFEQQVEQQLCERHPLECEPDSPKLRRRRRLTWGDLMRGTEVLLSYVAAGSPVVEVAEAERRAAICAGCPANTSFDKPCGGLCQRLVDMVRSAVGNRRTSHHDQLKACGVCHCLLEAAVQMPLEHQCKGVTEEMKVEFAEYSACWKKCV